MRESSKRKLQDTKTRYREMLASTLLSIHNIHTLLELARNLRQAILNGEFNLFASNYLSHLLA